ncbi:MAG: helicase-exonuclease AddAB subunit AddA [Oscillospiraceae bacterium]|nr:helicase-exonuclease AddAB subunit AddA [Oscillospiraceae bacterium]
MKSWTEAQSDAIYSRGGPLLVGAAAGSGKTAVLVERAISLICDGQNPVEADRLLIVTYTNAAAAEMKQRIAQRLSELMKERPLDLRLIKQRALLGQAAIGTIHSFCLGLVRENFQHLPVGQDFSLGGEGELSLLRESCAMRVIESFYAGGGKDFLALVELISGGRDDSRISETLLRLYDFARSHPFYLDWLRETAELYNLESGVEETGWGRALISRAEETLVYCIEALKGVRDFVLTDAAASGSYGGPVIRDIAMLEECLASLGAGWDKAVACVLAGSFARLGPLKGHEEIKARVKPVRERVARLFGELKEKVLSATNADFLADMADLRPKVAVLFEMAEAFAKDFADVKASKKRMDFSDLEHFALSLLVTRDEKGGYRKTKRAEEISLRYDAVLVDEFQDVNEVQDKIFTCVSRMEENLFMVGDPKQSIYSFRLATPAIFLKRREGSFIYQAEQRQFPARIALGKNFRSREEVLYGVNFIFSMLMSQRLGEIDYEGEELLVPGASYPAGKDNSPEFLLLDAGGYEGEEDSSCLEAGMVAKRIADMLEKGFEVAEGERTRPCRPGDFCILMRSPKRRMRDYVNALEGRDIPVWAQSGEGFLKLREVAMILSLMRAMDNPLRDIPLCGALLSPLFGFSEAELAAIRLAGRKMPFYKALVQAAGGEGVLPYMGLSERVRRFLELFYALRRRAAILPVPQLLLEAYSLTDALAVAQAMPAGETRRANLLLLIEYAAEYNELGYKGISGFVGFLDRLEERGGDLSPAGKAGENSNAVKIMSVHRSKGLEFPIVFLAGTAARFNLNDLTRTALLHSRYGFACMRRDPVTAKQYPTVQMQAIRIEGRRSALSEELRVLYVALTRAREKLIVTACPRGNLGRKLASFSGELLGGRISPRAAEEAGCLADWMMMALLRHPDGLSLREKGECLGMELVNTCGRWRVEIIEQTEKGEAGLETRPPAREAKPDEKLLARLKEDAAWAYPYAARTLIPAKLAVSDAARGEEADDYRFKRRPRFLAERGLTGAEKGDAMHKFMQFSSYERAREDIEGEIARLLRQSFFTRAQADSLDRGRLRAFFEGALAKRIFAADRVMRELRFTGLCPPDTVGYAAGRDDGSRIVLQGVADCVFIEKGSAVIVDYKTDRVASGEELAGRYRRQLDLYRAILSEALAEPIGECCLYSFYLGQEIILA